jgi:excisionase family DNA binding protein
VTTTENTTVAMAPLLLTVEQAAERLGVGRTTLFGLIASGEVESVSLGRLRRVPAECLNEYVRRLRAQHANNTTTAA